MVLDSLLLPGRFLAGGVVTMSTPVRKGLS